jgi:hypothetical protein
MNLNLMNFLVGKVVAEKLGEQRSTQLGLVAGMMPGFQGVLMSAVIAQREEAPTSTKPIDPKVAEQQAAILKRLQEVLTPPAAALK